MNFAILKRDYLKIAVSGGLMAIYRYTLVGSIISIICMISSVHAGIRINSNMPDQVPVHQSVNNHDSGFTHPIPVQSQKLSNSMQSNATNLHFFDFHPTYFGHMYNFRSSNQMVDVAGVEPFKINDLMAVPGTNMDMSLATADDAVHFFPGRQSLVGSAFGMSPDNIIFPMPGIGDVTVDYDFEMRLSDNTLGYSLTIADIRKSQRAVSDPDNSNDLWEGIIADSSYAMLDGSEVLPGIVQSSEQSFQWCATPTQNHSNWMIPSFGYNCDVDKQIGEAIDQPLMYDMAFNARTGVVIAPLYDPLLVSVVSSYRMGDNNWSNLSAHESALSSPLAIFKTDEGQKRLKFLGYTSFEGVDPTTYSEDMQRNVTLANSITADRALYNILHSFPEMPTAANPIAIEQLTVNQSSYFAVLHQNTLLRMSDHVRNYYGYPLVYRKLLPQSGRLGEIRRWAETLMTKHGNTYQLLKVNNMYRTWFPSGIVNPIFLWQDNVSAFKNDAFEWNNPSDLFKARHVFFVDSGNDQTGDPSQYDMAVMTDYLPTGNKQYILVPSYQDDTRDGARIFIIDPSDRESTQLYLAGEFLSDVGNKLIKLPISLPQGVLSFDAPDGFVPYEVSSANLDGDICADIVVTWRGKHIIQDDANGAIFDDGQGHMFANGFSILYRHPQAGAQTCSLSEKTMHDPYLITLYPDNPVQNRKVQIASVDLGDMDANGSTDILVGNVIPELMPNNEYAGFSYVFYTSPSAYSTAIIEHSPYVEVTGLGLHRVRAGFSSSEEKSDVWGPGKVSIDQNGNHKKSFAQINGLPLMLPNIGCNAFDDRNAGEEVLSVYESMEAIEHFMRMDAVRNDVHLPVQLDSLDNQNRPVPVRCRDSHIEPCSIQMDSKVMFPRNVPGVMPERLTMILPMNQESCNQFDTNQGKSCAMCNLLCDGNCRQSGEPLMPRQGAGFVLCEALRTACLSPQYLSSNDSSEPVDDLDDDMSEFAKRPDLVIDDMGHYIAHISDTRLAKYTNKKKPAKHIVTKKTDTDLSEMSMRVLRKWDVVDQKLDDNLLELNQDNQDDIEENAPPQNQGVDFSRINLNIQLPHGRIMPGYRELTVIGKYTRIPECGNDLIENGEMCEENDNVCSEGQICNKCQCEDVPTPESYCGNNVWDEDIESCDLVDGDRVGCDAGSRCNNSCECDEVTAVCGNGLFEFARGESCEQDEHCAPGYTCESCSCKLNINHCGNGKLDENIEKCDMDISGNVIGCQADERCNKSCECEAPPVPICGNGLPEEGEKCGEPSLQCDSGFSCADCVCERKQPVCGNAKFEKELGESCDRVKNWQGKMNDVGCQVSEQCNNSCECEQRPARCGNQIVETGETCESSADCKIGLEECNGCECVSKQSICGDGLYEPLLGEKCDFSLDKKGTVINSQGCSYGDRCNSFCECETVKPECGNFIQELGEQCEVNSDCQRGYECSGCECVRQTPICGNAKWEIPLGEECEVVKGQSQGCLSGYSCDDACQCVQGIDSQFSRPIAECGNKKKELGEQCESNSECGKFQECSDCKCIDQPAMCGNGIRERGESCESNSDCGEFFTCNDCQCSIVPSQCHNGVKELGEACETDADCGSGMACDECNCTTSSPVCGNYSLDKGEACEKNSHCLAGQVCNSCECIDPSPVCGNKKVEAGEACELSSDCGVFQECNACQCIDKAAICGNQVREPGETCEKDIECGPGKSCNNCDCEPIGPFCGNDKLDVQSEQCDLVDGILMGCAEGSHCTNDCQCEQNQAICGDGNWEKPMGEACEENSHCGPGETCDECVCIAQEVKEESMCGNGIVDESEACGEAGLSCSENEECQACECRPKEINVQVAACGNGVLDQDETCGEPGLSMCMAGDRCNANCMCEAMPQEVPSQEDDCIVMQEGYSSQDMATLYKSWNQRIAQKITGRADALLVEPGQQIKVICYIGKSAKLLQTAENSTGPQSAMPYMFVQKKGAKLQMHMDEKGRVFHIDMVKSALRILPLVPSQMLGKSTIVYPSIGADASQIHPMEASSINQSQNGITVVNRGILQHFSKVVSKQDTIEKSTEVSFDMSSISDNSLMHVMSIIVPPDYSILDPTRENVDASEMKFAEDRLLSSQKIAEILNQRVTGKENTRVVYKDLPWEENLNYQITLYQETSDGTKELFAGFISGRPNDGFASSDTADMSGASGCQLVSSQTNLGYLYWIMMGLVIVLSRRSHQKQDI